MLRFYRFVCSVNAKDIGVLYLISSVVGGIIGFSYSVIIRLELSNSGRVYLSSAELYNTCITLLGLIMIFFFVMRFLISGLGNYFIRIMLGQIDMCFPRLNNISYWLWLFSFILLLTSGVIDYGRNGGWTLYVRLSTIDYSSSTSVDILIFSLLLAGISSLLGSINFITTIYNNRLEFTELINVRIFIWCMFITNILLLLSLPVLAVAITFILTDRNINTTFYNAKYSGDAVLYQLLFWIFGLREVKYKKIINLKLFKINNIEIGIYRIKVIKK